MFDFSVRRETIHACTFALCMSVWYGVRVCAVCTFIEIIKKKKEERKSNSELNELWSMYRYLVCVAQSARVNGIHVQKVQK